MTQGIILGGGAHFLLNVDIFDGHIIFHLIFLLFLKFMLIFHNMNHLIFVSKLEILPTFSFRFITKTSRIDHFWP